MIKLFVLGCILGAVLTSIGITGVTHYMKQGVTALDSGTNKVVTAVKKNMKIIKECFEYVFTVVICTTCIVLPFAMYLYK